MIKSLQHLGLSEKEAQVFLDLSKEGESKTGQICSRTKIPSSHIYSVLDSLIHKGLVSYKLINNIKHYHPAEPDYLSELFEKKVEKLQKEKKEVMNVVTNLKRMPKEEDYLTDFKIFTGIQGIKSMLYEVMASWDKRYEYMVLGSASEIFERMEAFLIKRFQKTRIEKEVGLKVLVNAPSKEWKIQAKYWPKTEVRYTKIKACSEFGIYKDMLIMLSFGKHPYGIMIKDKNFVEMHYKIFQELWANAKT